jgi:hypothetical protein
MNQDNKNTQQKQQETQNDFFYLSKSEKKYFTTLFNERCNEKNEILYSDFKEIVYNYRRFEGDTTRQSIDKIKRKNSISTLSEADMQICIIPLIKPLRITSISSRTSRWNTKKCRMRRTLN